MDIKKIIKNVIYSTGVITITAGLVFAVDLGLNLNSGDFITYTVWNNLVNQVGTNVDNITSQDSRLTTLENSTSSGTSGTIGGIGKLRRRLTGTEDCSVLLGTDGYCSGTAENKVYNCNSGYTKQLISTIPHESYANNYWDIYFCVKP